MKQMVYILLAAAATHAVESALEWPIKDALRHYPEWSVRAQMLDVVCPCMVIFSSILFYGQRDCQ